MLLIMVGVVVLGVVVRMAEVVRMRGSVVVVVGIVAVIVMKGRL